MKNTNWLFRTFFLAVCIALFGCASDKPPTSVGYGPLTFNKPNSDFYFFQGGKFVKTEIAKDGVIEIYLSGAPFQIGYNGRQLNLALAQVPIEEISTDPKGYKASRLSGPMSGAREENSDSLLVYSGTKWTDGNVEFSDETSKKATPMLGFQHAYQINKLEFLHDTSLSLNSFKGVLYGYIVVYKQPNRMNKDIMPVRIHLN